jgi:hypothetical protein
MAFRVKLQSLSSYAKAGNQESAYLREWLTSTSTFPLRIQKPNKKPSRNSFLMTVPPHTLLRRSSLEETR